MEKLIEAMKELIALLEGGPSTQYSGNGDNMHDHILFDNIDRARISKIKALIESAEQEIGK